MEKVLLIEPFYGGSHRQLIDLLYERVPGCVKVTMSPKKWHWRSRTSSLHLSQTIPPSDTYRVLFSSSVLNLAELVALRPDLAKLKKILYFHENQLIYPVRKNQDRDFQYGYNQIISSLVADVVVFNSAYNMESFLSSIKGFLKLMPDYRPSGLAEKIRPKCQVIHFPLHFPDHITHEVEPKEETSNSHMHQNLEHKNLVRKNDDKIDAVKPKNICLETNDGNNISHFETMENGENSNFGFCKERNLNDETVNDKGDHLGAKQGFSVEREDSLVRESLPGEGRVHSTSEDSSEDTRMDCTTSMAEPVPENKCLASAESVTGENSLVEAGLATRTSQTLVEEEQLTVEAPVSRSENTCTQTAESEAKVIQGETTTSLPLHVVWPHRWEHDKDPDTFLNTMIKLHDNGINFHLSVLGEQFTDVPEIFERAKSILGDRIVHWGHQASKEDYYRVLSAADVVVSTSLHEFFGVAMLEAVHHNCYPLCPNRLVYPEIFPECYLYNTPNQLYKTLKRLCIHPNIVRGSKVQMSIEKYLWKNIAVKFEELLETGVT